MENQNSIYLEEAKELLEELEEVLLLLEEEPGNREYLDRAFRALHTIKGSGSMFGYSNIAEFVHTIETVFDDLREGRLQVSQELITLTLQSVDVIREMLNPWDGENGWDIEKQRCIEQAFQKLIPERSEAHSLEKEKPDQWRWTYRIRFRPGKDTMKNGLDPFLALKELHAKGVATIYPNTDSVPVLDEIAPESAYFSWDILLSSNKGAHEIEDVFIFWDKTTDYEIRQIDDTRIFDFLDYKKLGEILVERKDITPEHVHEALRSQKRVGEILMEKQWVGKDALHSALAEQKKIKEMRKDRCTSLTASSIRVEIGKLDILLNLVGELVTAQARLGNLVKTVQEDIDSMMFGENSHLLEMIQPHMDIQRFTEELPHVTEEMERITDELRNNTMWIRMVPISSIFNRFRRITRELSLEFGKDAVLITEGGETELDKTVIDKLHDPLVHILRNAISHGIESPDKRRSKGKPARGTITLHAEHKASNVEIRIKDDGRGLDTEAILKKAVAKGLVHPEESLSEKEAVQLIFTPGFSTADAVSDISGRGVGMDVVLQNIESIQGSVDVESIPGKGAEIILTLPLSLAIIDGLLVEVGRESYIIPLFVISKCLEPNSEELVNIRRKEMIRYMDAPVSYVSLRRLFSPGTRYSDTEKIVIVETDKGLVGLGVDMVFGKRQIVLKKLGGFYRNHDGFSGATILGDGTVGMVLDVNRLVEQG